MKRTIIVHCWDGNSEYAWYPSVAKQLTDMGYKVDVPNMPETSRPDMAKWLPVLVGLVDQPDEDLVLIGHSIGSVAIMRYLEQLADGQRIGQAILVAGFDDNLGYREISSFFQSPFDFGKIKAATKNGIAMIQSDNDPYISMDVSRKISQALGADMVIKHGAGHMSGSVDNEESCLNLPEILQVLK